MIVYIPEGLDNSVVVVILLGFALLAREMVEIVVFIEGNEICRVDLVLIVVTVVPLSEDK